MDQNIVCMICSQNFLYSEREQGFMKDLFDRGKIEELVAPKRCLECRRSRRQSAPRAPLAAPIPIPVFVQPPAAPAPALAPVPAPAPALVLSPPPSNGSAHDPEPEIRVVLVAGDFEKLVCREEVVIHQGNRKIRIRLADIGPEALKRGMEKAVLSWWKS